MTKREYAKKMKTLKKIRAKYGNDFKITDEFFNNFENNNNIRSIIDTIKEEYGSDIVVKID